MQFFYWLGYGKYYDVQFYIDIRLAILIFEVLEVKETVVFNQ